MKPLAFICFGAVGIKPGRIKNCQKAMLLIAEELYSLRIENDFQFDARVKLINVIIREGFKRDEAPTVGAYDKRHSEIPLTFEVPLDEFRDADVEYLVSHFAHMTKLGIIMISKTYLVDPRVGEKLTQLSLK
jgi:hypothetical protein